MTRNKLLFILLCLAILFGGAIYWQYTFYRTPASTTEKSATFEEADLYKTEAGIGSIPAITDPDFESVGAADMYLDDRGTGLAVLLNGQARFYPYQILIWHSLVNDQFDAESLLITYCPLCASGMVFEREAGGSELIFETTGEVWNNNLVFIDQQSESRWVQQLAQAVSGDLTGSQLTPYSATEMTWDDFKDIYPQGRVLSRNTGFERDYTRDPYEDYEDRADILFPLVYTDERMQNKDLVLGVVSGEEARAYPLTLFEDTDEIDDVFKGYPLTIQKISDHLVIKTDAPINSYQTYWFCFSAAHPETSIYTY